MDGQTDTPLERAQVLAADTLSGDLRDAILDPIKTPARRPTTTSRWPTPAKRRRREMGAPFQMPGPLELALGRKVDAEVIAALTPAPIEILLHGKPQAWQRARLTKTGIHFTPKQTRVKEATIAALAEEVMRGRARLEGAVEMDVIACSEIPQSWSKKKREAAARGEIRPTSRPDWDNLGKLFSDALNGIVYRDDAQVVDARVRKIYGAAAYTKAIVREIA